MIMFYDNYKNKEKCNLYAFRKEDINRLVRKSEYESTTIYLKNGTHLEVRNISEIQFRDLVKELKENIND